MLSQSCHGISVFMLFSYSVEACVLGDSVPILVGIVPCWVSSTGVACGPA